MPNAFLFDPGARHKHRYTFHERAVLILSGWWDLNPRPPGPEPGAIPSFATARFTYEKATFQPLPIFAHVRLVFDISGVLHDIYL